MIITSQSPRATAAPLAAAAANAATLGIGAALRASISEADPASRERLEDMRLSEPLRDLLDRKFRERAAGSVEHQPVDAEIGRQLQIQFTVARMPAREIVLLQIPAAILKDGSQIRRLLVLSYVLRGRTVRVLSPDLDGEPSSAFNGLKQIWADEDDPGRRIEVDFVPMSHVEELEQGAGELGNVLKLDLQAAVAGGVRPRADTPSGNRPDAFAPGRAGAVPGPPPLRIVQVFLASSAELRADRDAFDLYFRQQNDQLLKQGLYLQITRWESFLDAMSETRLQDEYNRAIRGCDIFVSLFMRKTGKFTEEEFDVAHAQFKATGKPRIYTFFKNAEIRIGDIDEDEVLSLLQFKKKLAALGHFHTGYDDIEHLKRQFRDQLDRLLT